MIKIPFSGLSGPVLSFANAVQRAFDQLRSVPSQVYQTDADLPEARLWEGRRVLIRDLAGQPGEATAIDGVWVTRSLG